MRRRGEVICGDMESLKTEKRRWQRNPITNGPADGQTGGLRNGRVRRVFSRFTHRFYFLKIQFP